MYSRYVGYTFMTNTDETDIENGYYYKSYARERERESLFTKYIYITYTYQLLQWQAASEGISPP